MIDSDLIFIPKYIQKTTTQPGTCMGYSAAWNRQFDQWYIARYFDKLNSAYAW